MPEDKQGEKRMLRTCDRCGVGDDYYTMYFGFNEDNEVNVICDECAQEHKDEYTDLVSVHTIAKIMPKIENKIRTEVLNDSNMCSTHQVEEQKTPS